MMKKPVFAVIFSFLLLSAVHQAAAQSSTNSTTATTTTAFDMTGFPQWAKDMRRFDVITFGVFPFSWFFINFFYDMHRWRVANGMEFSADGRRYAPWPMKTAGAAEMTNEQYRNTIIMAASLSVAVAITDLIIVKVKRKRERRRIESRPAGSVIINKTPYGQVDDDAENEVENADDTDEPDDPELGNVRR